MQVASAVGISRATAQRYLATLVQAGSLRLELTYGSRGRPEHRYLVQDALAAGRSPGGGLSVSGGLFHQQGKGVVPRGNAATVFQVELPVHRPCRQRFR